eukprot:1472259-Prymnesium_polylepis.1
MGSFELPSLSPFKRTCALARFVDRRGGQTISVLSAHLDHVGGDEVGQLSEARRESASLVMARARAEVASGADAVFVTGDFNTFLDREGETYQALLAAGRGEFTDVRDAVPVGFEIDCGRADSSWEGWPDNAFARSKKGDQRYDQLLVSIGVRVLRTSVHEDKYPGVAGEGPAHLYASDHLPIVADCVLSASAGWKAALGLARAEPALALAMGAAVLAGVFAGLARTMRA